MSVSTEDAALGWSELAGGVGVGDAIFSGALGAALGSAGLDVGVGAEIFSPAVGSPVLWSGLDVGTVAVVSGGGRSVVVSMLCAPDNSDGFSLAAGTAGAAAGAAGCGAVVSAVEFTALFVVVSDCAFAGGAAIPVFGAALSASAIALAPSAKTAPEVSSKASEVNAMSRSSRRLEIAKAAFARARLGILALKKRWLTGGTEIEDLGCSLHIVLSGCDEWW